MRFSILALTFLLTSTLWGQQEFAALWKEHRAGKDVAASLTDLMNRDGAGNKDRFNAAYALSVFALGKGEAERAHELLDRAEKLVPKTAQVAVRRAEAFLLAKDYKKAKFANEKAKKAVGRKKKSAIFRRQRIVSARLNAANGKYEKAVKTLKSLAARDKKNWELHFFLGRFYEAQDQPRDAIASYEAAIENLPKVDPCIGVYAYQRFAALSVSSQAGSYGNKKLLTKAIANYKKFLERAEANGVPRKLINEVNRSVSTLGYFAKGR